VRTDIRPKPGHAGDFFSGATIDVARRLIGATLYHRISLGRRGRITLSGRIVETEAYLPLVDPACHGYRGPTPRNASLFGRPGFSYVYLIYGMYFCLNVTTEPPGVGAAVLIRALEPLEGIEYMRQRRGMQVPIMALTSGPGNLCRAMNIDRKSDGLNLRSGDLYIKPSQHLTAQVRVSRRIGLNVAEKWPLRFYDSASLSVSPFRNRRKLTQHR
jgi:DNA-3-methyladenine glycosylase